MGEIPLFLYIDCLTQSLPSGFASLQHLVSAHQKVAAAVFILGPQFFICNPEIQKRLKRKRFFVTGEAAELDLMGEEAGCRLRLSHAGLTASVSL